jgi:Family of unknown function (DUF6221)
MCDDGLMDDLIAFLAARLDEVEAAAKSAAAETAVGWFTDTSEEPDERSVRYTAPNTLHPSSTWDYSIADRVPLAAAVHIVRHDPGRALREVKAKRAIIRLAATGREWTDGSAGATAGYAAVVVSDALRALAAVYSDHPDYRAEENDD